MKNITRYILLYALFSIVIYVNFYEKTAIWRLVYYSQYYSIVSIVMIFAWKKYRDNLTRSLIIGLGFYYGFELIMDIINVFNPDLHSLWYKKRYINYACASGVGISLLVLPVIKRIKKWKRS